MDEGAPSSPDGGAAPATTTTAAAAAGNPFLDASNAVEVAYRRLIQVRRSLLELSDTLNPNNDNTQSVEQTTIADDLVPEAEMERLRATLPPDVMNRVTQFEESTRRAEILNARHALIRSRARTLAPSVPATSSPSTASQDLLSALRQRIASTADDPSTSLGRHLAAREATSDGRMSSRDLDDPLTLSRLTSEIAELNGRLLARAAARLEARSAGGESTSPAEERRSLEQTTATLTRASASLMQAAQRAQSSTADYDQLARSQGQIRLRASQLEERRLGLRQSTGSSTTSSATRLSMLSNFSGIQNLGTPSSAGLSSRPMLFVQDPESYESDYPEFDRPGYNVRRRLNELGEEVVHTIDGYLLEDDEEWESTAWPPVRRPRPMLTAESLAPLPARRWPREFRRRETPLGQPSAMDEYPERRRRAWARLDADGNEIPAEEEDELERSRELMRIHTENMARSGIPHLPHASTLAPNPAAELVLRAQAFAPVTTTTRNPISHQLDEDEDHYNSVRVRLNSASTRPVGQTRIVRHVARPAASRYVNISSSRRYSTRDGVFPYEDDTFGSAKPFEVDPLPTPLEEMVPVKLHNTTRRVHVASVIMAGR